MLNPKSKQAFLGNADELINHIHETYGTAGDRMLYTEEQLRRIDLASALHISLNHPSDVQLMEMISSFSFINCPITGQDLKNMRAVEGPCIRCLEGKPKPHKGSHPSNDIKAEPELPGEMIHCDIVSVKGRPRLFGVDHVSGYCTYNVMENKTTKEVCLTFDELINAYHGYKKLVRYISCMRCRPHICNQRE